MIKKLVKIVNALLSIIIIVKIVITVVIVKTVL